MWMNTPCWNTSPLQFEGQHRISSVCPVFLGYMAIPCSTSLLVFLTLVSMQGWQWTSKQDWGFTCDKACPAAAHGGCHVRACGYEWPEGSHGEPTGEKAPGRNCGFCRGYHTRAGFNNFFSYLLKNLRLSAVTNNTLWNSIFDIMSVVGLCIHKNRNKFNKKKSIL